MQTQIVKLGGNASGKDIGIALVGLVLLMAAAKVSADEWGPGYDEQADSYQSYQPCAHPNGANEKIVRNYFL